MKHEWYGDKRDLVKWAVLMRLASIHKVQRVLQIGLVRPTIYQGLQLNGKPYSIPNLVTEHFRDLKKIESIKGGIRVHLFGGPFLKRKGYWEQVLAFINKHGSERAIVFLDPDTGLEPPKARPTMKHVRGTEAKTIWDKMKPGDVFAIYQHKTTRKSKPWMELKRQQLQESLSMPNGAVKVAEAPKLDKTVVIFYAKKGN